MAETAILIEPKRHAAHRIENLHAQRAARVGLDQPQFGRQPPSQALVGGNAGRRAQRQRAAKKQSPVHHHENLSALRLPNRMSPSSLARNCA